MLQQVSIIGTTKDYITLRIPRFLVRGLLHEEKEVSLSEMEALKILRFGMKEYRMGKTKKLASLKNLRHGN